MDENHLFSVSHGEASAPMLIEQSGTGRRLFSHDGKAAVIAFAVLGVFVPIMLYPVVAYERPLPRGSDHLAGRLATLVPYLWPSAPIVPIDRREIGTAVVYWAISLGLNVLIYSIAGWALWRAARFVRTVKEDS
jgi:hypothetical protein